MIEQNQEIKIGTSLPSAPRSAFTICPKNVLYSKKDSVQNHALPSVVSSVSFNLKRFPPSFLDFHDLDTFEDCRPGVL